MNKKLEVKVKIDTQIDITANPNSDDWNGANDESKNLYVKELVKDYIIMNIDVIIDDLMEDIKIEF
jgi:hypothetical protein